MPKKEVEKKGSGDLELSKEAFFHEVEKLRPDLVYPESWSDETKAKAAEFVKPEATRKRMLGIIPMSCRGEQCQLNAVCPLVKAKIAPVGSPCPIETNLIAELMTSYMYELGVNPNSMIEVSMIKDLVNQEVQQHRATWLLSIEDFIQENVVGVSPDGDLIKQKQLHLAVELEDRLQKRKKELRTQFLATRQARAQAGQGNIDTAQAISNLMGEVRHLEKTNADLLMEKAGIKSSDEYIDAEVVDDADAY